MVLVCYSFGIRSERRLHEELHLNPALVLSRVDPRGSVPVTQYFPELARPLRENDVFRRVFKEVVRA